MSVRNANRRLLHHGSHKVKADTFKVQKVWSEDERSPLERDKEPTAVKRVSGVCEYWISFPQSDANKAEPPRSAL